MIFSEVTMLLDRGAPPKVGDSADVAFDRLHVARLRLIGVAAELAPCATLAQQIPALVELFFDALATIVSILRRLVVAGERPLLVDEALDAAEDVVVGHAPSMPRAERRARSRQSPGSGMAPICIIRPIAST